MPTVLFVDDEVAILEILRRSLLNESYVVITADSAAKALDILANTRVDVVVSDEQMPSMLGSKFLGRVRDAYPNIVRIILTGGAGLPAAVRAINEGPLYRFLSKPLSPDELVRTIRQALQMKFTIEQNTDLHRIHDAEKLRG
jgi:DNA-binding NtrC family response regulator